MDLGLLNETHANEAGGQLDSLRQSRVAFNECDDIAIFELMNESHDTWLVLTSPSLDVILYPKNLDNTSTQRRPI